MPYLKREGLSENAGSFFFIFIERRLNMGGWQITWLVIALLGLGCTLAKHGELKGYYNFWVSLASFGIELLILIKGGFFN